MRLQEKETDVSCVQSCDGWGTENAERKEKETMMNARTARLCRLVNRVP